MLLGILKFFYGLIHNWGVAIMLLTLMVKVALVPLSVKAMASAEAMKKLQPKMEEIKKKYGEDRERQQLETMKLYQEAKVNPVGGCLPMLVQIPMHGSRSPTSKFMRRISVTRSLRSIPRARRRTRPTLLSISANSTRWTKTSETRLRAFRPEAFLPVPARSFHSD